MAASQNDLIRAYQTELIDKGVDLTVKSTRQEHLEIFLKKHPDLNRKSATAAWSHLLPKTAKAKGVDPDKVKSAPRVKAHYDKKSLNQHLNANPVDEPKDQQGPNWRDGQRQQAGPQQQQAQQQQPTGPYTVETVAAFFDGLHSTLRIFIPEAEPLGKDDKESLGGIWVAEFNKRLAGHENASLLLGIVATAGILGANLHAGVRKGREKAARAKTVRGAKEAAQEAAADFQKKAERGERPGSTENWQELEADK